MQIHLNGADTEATANNLAELVTGLGLNPRNIAIEQNRTIIPNSAFANTAINDNDTIEIVHFIGGG